MNFESAFGGLIKNSEVSKARAYIARKTNIKYRFMEYKICSVCVMDVSDSHIFFDDKGVCNHCRNFEHISKYKYFPTACGESKLMQKIDYIKKKQKSRPYDVVLGLSGGVDSSFLAYWAVKNAKLRVLAVHVDCGWNSELATKNIELIVKKLGLDLLTIVIDWNEMQDLQLSFLEAGVPNQDIPQDHAIFASLYKTASQKNIKYVINGSNLATEGILPHSWGYNALDSKHLFSVHKLFGKKKLRTFPTMSLFNYYFSYPFLRGIKTISPLNNMAYDKEKAIKVLENEFGWKYYGAKHFESRFTKFFQSYWLVKRFGYDKRRAHLSSLIVSGFMSRKEALDLLKLPAFDESQINNEKIFVAKKLGIDVPVLENLMSKKLCSHEAYKSHKSIFGVIKKIYWKLFLMRKEIFDKAA